MRRENWGVILAGVVAERESAPFAWGRHDCCLFAADVVMAMTGIDHAAPFRGKYDTAVGAARLLARYGGIAGYCNSVLGPAQPVTMAGRGDVVAIETDHGEALGICLGAVSVFAGPTGLSRCQTLRAIASWRIA